MREATWDLSVFYQGFDDPAFRADLDAVKELLAQGRTLLENPAGEQETLEALVDSQETISNKLSKAFGYCQLTLATDATDQTALRYLDELSALMVEVRVMESSMARYIGGVQELEALIEKSEKLKRNAFALREAKTLAAHLLDEKLEKWMLRMSLSGGDAFCKLRDQLMGTLTVELDGARLPLPAVRGMAYDPDPNVRRKAYEAELSSYKQVEVPMAFCLSSIKGEALTMAEARGYDSVLSQTLAQSRMDQGTLDALWTAIGEYLPHFRRYLRAKAKYMGYANGLPFYELFAPIGESAERFTIDQARDLLLRIFGKAHPQMGAFMQHAFDNRWIDVYPKEGKEGGAFCAENHELDLSRILTNFVGSFSDVSTLAHELGHAWHARCMQRVPVLMAQPPMPLAETASIFNETLLAHEVLQSADAAQALPLLEGKLMEATQVVVDIYSRFLFESAVLEARKTHTPNAEELCGLMLDAQDKAYGEGLDASIRHPYMWVNKSHYYSTDLHFYNFPYAFGLLFGLGVFARYLEKGPAFLPEYDALLSRCGSDTVANVAASVGIDVRSADFWRSSLEVLRGEIDQFVDMVEKR